MSGEFGGYGGRYVPETLIPALDELTAAWEAAKSDPSYQAEIDDLASHVRRPPLAADAARSASLPASASISSVRT